MKNSMAMFALSIFEGKYPFMANLFKKKTKLFAEDEIWNLD